MWQKQYKQVNKEISDWMTRQREWVGVRRMATKFLFLNRREKNYKTKQKEKTKKTKKKNTQKNTIIINTHIWHKGF